MYGERKESSDGGGVETGVVRSFCCFSEAAKQGCGWLARSAWRWHQNRPRWLARVIFSVDSSMQVPGLGFPTSGSA
jgi:hypothetical protein